jgi:hypothetical protein
MQQKEILQHTIQALGLSKLKWLLKVSWTILKNGMTS